MMDYAGLKAAIKTQLATVASSLSPATTVEWYGEPSNPRSRTLPWVEASIRYGTTETTALGSTCKNAVYGVVFLNLFASMQADDSVVLRLGQALLEGFPKGLKISFGDNDILFKVGYIETPLKREQFWMYPVTLPFTAYMEV